MKTFYILTILCLMTNFIMAEPKEHTQKQMKPALLIIDIQNKYLPQMDEADTKPGLRNINSAIWLFREYKLPIIRIYHSDPRWGPKPDSEEFQFPTSIQITEDDPKIVKNYANGFKKTDLEKLLHEKECNTLFLCGLSAVGCVLATYFGAHDRDFDTFMIKDALISPNAAYTNVIEDICQSVSLMTVWTMLKYTIPTKDPIIKD